MSNLRLNLGAIGRSLWVKSAQPEFGPFDRTPASRLDLLFFYFLYSSDLP